MTVQTALKSVDSFRNVEVLKMTQKENKFTLLFKTKLFALYRIWNLKCYKLIN